MFLFQFTFKDTSIESDFLSGHNIELQEDNILEAVIQFNKDKPNCKVEAILKRDSYAGIAK